MRNNLLPLIKWPVLETICTLAALMLLPSCQDQIESTYTYQTQIPVYMQMSTVREGEVIIQPGRPLDNPGKIYLYGGREDMFALNSSSGGESYGQGGSMARFTLMNGHLYAVDDYSLRIFDVRVANTPEYLDHIQLGWGIETIFPF